MIGCSVFLTYSKLNVSEFPTVNFSTCPNLYGRNFFLSSNKYDVPIYGLTLKKL